MSFMGDFRILSRVLKNKRVKGFNLFICRLSMYDRPGKRSPEYDFR